MSTHISERAIIIPRMTIGPCIFATNVSYPAVNCGYGMNVMRNNNKMMYTIINNASIVAAALAIAEHAYSFIEHN